jgi:hypothetical protein
MLCAHISKDRLWSIATSAVDPIFVDKMAHNGVVNAGSNVHLSAWRSWGFPNNMEQNKEPYPQCELY